MLNTEYSIMEVRESVRVELWMQGFLLLAGVYNLGWGFFIYKFPDAFYQWVTLEDHPALPVIEWQGLGVMLFGLFYVLVAFYPTRFWYLLVAGLCSKIVGALGFYLYVMEGHINKKFLFHLIMNDLIWIIPFGIIIGRMVTVRTTKKQRAL